MKFIKSWYHFHARVYPNFIYCSLLYCSPFSFKRKPINHDDSLFMAFGWTCWLLAMVQVNASGATLSQCVSNKLISALPEKVLCMHLSLKNEREQKQTADNLVINISYKFQCFFKEVLVTVFVLTLQVVRLVWLLEVQVNYWHKGHSKTKKRLWI